MSFENAAMSKGIMASLALTSFLIGLFDVKHFFHLQLNPHVSSHRQYWRLLSHQVAFANSSDLFLAELLLFNIAVQVERRFGSVKFASFIVLSIFLSVLIELVSLVMFHRFGFNVVPPGPVAMIFCILYQYARIVPAVYHFRVLGLPLNNKSSTYVLALFLGCSSFPESVVVAMIGTLVGQVYRSDLTNLKGFRVPSSFVILASRALLPVFSSSPAPRRSNRAEPGGTRPHIVDSDSLSSDDQIPRTRSTSNRSVVREWVNELTGRAERDRPNVSIRDPMEEEVAQVMAIFPEITRADAVEALQRSPNVSMAVDSLLRMRT